MAFFDISNPIFRPFVRKFLTSDWGHAEVLNATVEQLVKNDIAMYDAIFRINTFSVLVENWKNKEYRIEDSRIRVDSIVDIYYATASKETVLNANIEGRTENESIVLFCEYLPENDITIDCILVRNEVISDAG